VRRCLDDLKLAREILLDGGHAVVFVRGGVTLVLGDRPGVVDLMEIASAQGEVLRAAAVADKVIGRAAALLLRALGARAVYAARISDGGLAALEAGAIHVEYGERVAAILNRTQDGPCPFEQAVADIDEPVQALIALQQRLASLRAATPR
jgi:hypothetical protein